MPTLGQSAAAVAQVEADNTDAGFTGKIDNRSPQVDKYLENAGHLPKNPNQAGSPWCGMFVYYCYTQAARGAGRPNPLDSHAFSAHRLRDWARQRPATIVWQKQEGPGAARKARLQAGDIFVTASVHHIGMVALASDTPAYNFISVEGNQTSPGSKDPRGIKSKQRTLNDCSIIIRPC